MLSFKNYLIVSEVMQPLDWRMKPVSEIVYLKNALVASHFYFLSGVHLCLTLVQLSASIEAALPLAFHTKSW